MAQEKLRVLGVMGERREAWEKLCTRVHGWRGDMALGLGVKDCPIMAGQDGDLG